MQKTILVCGLIAGLISCSFFIGLMIIGQASNMNYDQGAVIGYSLMILAFSLIFVATKIIRDRDLGGSISFGRAFRIGLYISLIATAVYVIVWLIDLYKFNPDFAQKYSDMVLKKLHNSGAKATEIAAQTAQMNQMVTMYRNPLFVILLTAAEILPVGLLVSVISALLMKRKKTSATH